MTALILSLIVLWLALLTTIVAMLVFATIHEPDDCARVAETSDEDPRGGDDGYPGEPIGSRRGER